MKKILIVDNSAWNIYNFRLPLVKRLKREGFELIIATPVDEYIHYLNETDLIKHQSCKQLRPRSINPVRDVFLIFELLYIYYRKKPDLIIHFTIKPNIFGNFAARILGIPSISVVTGLGFTFLNPKGINKFIPLLYRVAFKKIKKLIVYNHDDKEVFINQNIISPNKCMIIPGSGVNTRFFRPVKKLNNKNKFIFLFIGRLLKDKGLIEFVEAGKKINKENYLVDIWVVGDFHDANPAAVNKDTLLQWVENKDIYYHGKTMDVRQVISESDAIVLPSYREGIPRVILEAMAMGKPIITTDTAGCRETVQHGRNGFLVPLRNVDALALAMSAMSCLSEKELHQMGAASRQIALNYFDEKIVVDSYLKLLTELFPNDKFAQNKCLHKLTSP